MAQYTANENLYKWSASDTKQTTITEMALNADKIDGKLNDHTVQLTDIAINVKSFGAKGDGVTDDSVAIQNAINTGKQVFFPDGTYLISTSLVPYNYKLRLIGNGWNESIIKTNSAIIMINAVGNDVVDESVFISNLQLDGNSVATGGIRFHKIQGDSILERVFVNHINGIGINYDGWCWTGSIVRTKAWNCTTGIRLGPGSNDITVDDCNLYQCNVGLELEGGTSAGRPNMTTIGTRITNSVFQALNETAILFSLFDAEIGVINVVNNYIEQCGMFLKGRNLPGYTWGLAKNINIIGNSVMLGDYGITPKNDFIDFFTINVAYFTLSQNYFSDSIANCVKLNGTSYGGAIYDNIINDAVTLYTGGYSMIARRKNIFENQIGFKNGIDFMNTQLTNAVPQHGTVRPPNPVDRQLFYDDTILKLIIYNALISSWVDMSGRQIATNKVSVTLTTTINTIADEIMPKYVGNFVIYVFYRVIGATDLTIKVTYRNASGTPVEKIIVQGAQTVGEYSLTPVFITARGNDGQSLKVEAIASVANNVIMSSVIEPK